MALLLAQPQHMTDFARPLGEAINRWLWRWSPWHLRKDLAEAQGDARFYMILSADLQRANRQLHQWLERDPLPAVPIYKDTAVLPRWDDVSHIQTYTVTFKQYAFAVVGDDFRFACDREELAALMADRFVRNVARDLKPRIEAELLAYAAKC